MSLESSTSRPFGEHRLYSGRAFDLNIEQVLEHWTVPHAVRELIANALDEQALTGTAEPEISRDNSGSWHVRDFGRGIRYEHLTLNENPEKLAHPDIMIGKFGGGLKDALATFDRHGIGVLIRSRHGDIRTITASKHEFDDIHTLHAIVDAPSDPDLQGTDLVLTGVSPNEVDQAKALFLKYAGDSEREVTPHGAIFDRSGSSARIYVNGLLIAEEPNFLFSYNITRMSAALRKALNRERSNVGRSAYSERVRAILLASSSPAVGQALARDLERYESGENHDELRWMDVQVHATKLLSSSDNVVFVTSQEVFNQSDLVDYAKADGHRPVIVPSALAAKLPGLEDARGNQVRDITTYGRELNDSFSFRFVDPRDLSDTERTIFDHTARIQALVSVVRPIVQRVLISETMRVDLFGRQVAGLWQPSDRTIIIKRDQLTSLSTYAGVLLHELAHAVSGTADRTIEFENVLTRFLGMVAAGAIK